MPKVAKVTVSLPASVLAFVERQRARTGATRSETVVSMLMEVQRGIEQAEREARYAAAYRSQPETEAERAFGYAATAALFKGAGEEWAGVSAAAGKPVPRRAPKKVAKKKAPRGAPR